MRIGPCGSLDQLVVTELLCRLESPLSTQVEGKLGGVLGLAPDTDPPPPSPKSHKSAGCRCQRHKRVIFLYRRG